jgi:c(7)-type cytochrome triheme protein
MRVILSCLIAVSFIGGFGLFAQKSKTPPTKLVFKTKNGDVTFDHSAHVMRAKEDCKTCHTALFKEDSKAALHYKPSVHKTAEKKMTSCGFCHRAGGTAFESKGNCNNCHMK